MSVIVEGLVGLGVAAPLAAAGYAVGRGRLRSASAPPTQTSPQAASSAQATRPGPAADGENDDETATAPNESNAVTTRNGATKRIQGSAERENRPAPGVAEETLRVLDLLTDAWLLVDRSDRVIARSRAADALGLVKDVDVRHSQLRDLVREARRRSSTVETTLALARGPIDAARVDLRIKIGVLSDELILVLVEDETQARRIEETRRDFVVNVSHELKTPVGGLRLLAEAVEDASDDPEAVARFAGRMKTETVRLASLVQEIVDLSRLQGSNTLATATPVDLDGCALRALDELRLIAEDRQIELQLASDDKPHIIMGDGNLLTTAIRNLVSNALNYSEANTRITVGLTRVDDDVLVEVADEGIGISPENLQRIFERFYRVDPARSRRTGGTGLGLAIVKHVCANHGGEVRVWSEPGVGSTFVLQFPAQTLNQTRTVLASSSPQELKESQ